MANIPEYVAKIYKSLGGLEQGQEDVRRSLDNTNKRLVALEERVNKHIENNPLGLNSGGKRALAVKGVGYGGLVTALVVLIEVIIRSV